jgi:hypothetical protein
LIAEATSLENKIAILKEILATIQGRLASATDALKRSKAQAADASERARETLSQLSKTRAELAAVSQSLKTARSEINAREETLAKIVQDINDKRRVQGELKAQMEIEAQKYQKIQTRLDRAAAQLSLSTQPQRPPATKTPPAPAPPPPTRKGFTLRFASDTALETLINRRAVQFFALAGQKAWKLNMTSGQPVYAVVPIPAEIYEMDTTTVPVSYTASFSRQVAAFGLDKVTWGVTLPEQTADAIARLIQNRDTGDLVIMPSGEVLLK